MEDNKSPGNDELSKELHEWMLLGWNQKSSFSFYS